ncbi:MAG: glutamate--tRNA ligase family protein, partial [Clostridia bacterium]
CIMSKRYLKKLVEEKVVDGWDDPRMPTICGLRRRGYTPESIKDFCERIGVAKANSELDIRNLEACVREDLNENAIRVMAVFNPIKVTLKNYEGSETLSIDNHPAKPEMGTHDVTFSKDLYIDASDFSLNPPKKYKRLTVGGLVRLKGAYIIKCNDVVLDNDGNVKELICEYLPETKSGNGDPDGLYKKVGTIQFVDANNAYEFEARNYGYLLNDEDYAGQDFAERINKNSMEKFKAIGEKYLEKASNGDRFQFMRMGYYIKDGKTNSFGEIVSLKDSFNNKND